MSVWTRRTNGAKKTKEEREREKNLRKAEEKQKDKVAKRMDRTKCYVFLAECKRDFQNKIFSEQLKVKERSEKGLDYQKQYDRLRYAAMGLRIIEKAEAALEDYEVDGGINSIYHLLGMALKQLKKVSEDVPSAGKRRINRRIAELFQDSKEEEEFWDYMKNVKIPDEIEGFVDKPFMDCLLQGDSYEECVAERLSKRDRETSAHRQTLLNDEAPSQEEKASPLSADDCMAIIERGEKF